MINYINGKIAYISKSYIILETYGIGYKIQMNNTNEFNLNDIKRIYIHSIVKTDNKNNVINDMYGFISPIERMLFKDLLQISGIGPVIANNIINYGYKTIVESIVKESIDNLKQIKGVNEKTAKQIVINLFDKYKKIAEGLDIQPSSISGEIISALKQLGYSESDIKLIVPKIDNKLELDENIGNCIRYIAKIHEDRTNS